MKQVMKSIRVIDVILLGKQQLTSTLTKKRSICLEDIRGFLDERAEEQHEGLIVYHPSHIIGWRFIAKNNL